MNLIKGSTIRNKVTIFNIIIIIITLFTLSYLSYRVYSQKMLDRAVESSYTEMLLINNNLDNLINNIESQARLLSINESIQEEMQMYNNNKLKSLDIIPEEVKRAYYDIIISNPLSMSASLLTSKNQILYFGDVDESSVEQIMDTDLIKLSKEVIKPQWMGPVQVVHKDGTNLNVFIVIKSIISRNSGNFLGTVFVYVRESDISDIYLNEHIKTKSNYHIIDNTGMVISSNEKNELYKPYSQIISDNDHNISKANHYKIIKSNDKDYLQNIYYYKKLDWRIINTVSIDEITLELVDVTKIIIRAAIACFIIAIILSAIISKSITMPISVMVKSMQRIRNGNLGERIECSKINSSEVGQLSQGFNELMDDMQSLMKDIKEEQEKRRNYEFQLIQSQIKPHFLYNTIETIISCIKLDMKETALKVSKSLASFYRSSLSKGDEIITIKKEIEITRNYLEIQGFRYSEYLDFKIDVDDNIQDFLIQKLILQPIVENAIYHGIKPREEKGEMIIKGWMQGDVIIFSVWDNGVGVDNKIIKNILSDSLQIDGFGLGSMNQRIKLMHGDRYGINIESELGKYTNVTIRIPALAKL